MNDLISEARLVCSTNSLGLALLFFYAMIFLVSEILNFRAVVSSYKGSLAIDLL